jgi:uncharacterized membrane protein YkvA (DUF1232 family)
MKDMKVLGLALIAAIYWLSPIDLIPDGLPLGLIDDIVVAILSGCGILNTRLGG